MANPSSDFGNSVANSAIDAGNKAINSFDPTATTTSQKNNLGSSGLGGLLGGQTSDYVKAYTDTIKGLPSVQNLYDTANRMYNIPQQQKVVSYLENTAANAIPDAYRGAKGFDIGDAAVQNGVASKLAYVNPQLNAANNNLTRSEGLASNYVQSGIQQNQLNLLPIQYWGTNLTQQEQNQALGWNQASHDELQGLIDKMNAGVTLTKAEIDRANVLAQQETSYENAITAANAAITVAKLNQQYQSVPYGGSLVNTFTGGVINPGVLTGSSGQYQLR